MQTVYPYHQASIHLPLNSSRQAKSLFAPRFQGKDSPLKASISVLPSDELPFYRGELPLSFQQMADLNQRQLYQALDQLADNLKKFESYKKSSSFLRRLLKNKVINGLVLTRTGKFLWYPATLDVNPLKIVKIGEGGYGSTYKIGTNPHAFVFKLYKGSTPRFSTEKAAEVGLDLVRRNITKDVCQFYAANPSKHWGLMEYINKTSAKNRTGITLQQAGERMFDAHRRNYVHGIRVDHDEVEPLGMPTLPYGRYD